jgi:hypothetical protein
MTDNIIVEIISALGIIIAAIISAIFANKAKEYKNECERIRNEINNSNKNNQKTEINVMNSTDNTEKFKEIDAKITHIKKQIEESSNLSTKSKEIEKTIKVLRKDFVSLLFSLADLFKPDTEYHFIYLREYFSMTASYELELEKDDLETIEIFISYIKDYKNIPQYLLEYFKKFINYCQTSNKQEHLKMANKALELLYEKKLITKIIG